MHLVLCLRGLPPLPLDLGRARGVEVPLGCRLGRAPASPSGAGEVGAARSLQTPISRASDFGVSPQFSPHVPRRENSRETSESCHRVLSSCGSRSSDRGSRKDKRARSRRSSSRGRRRSSRSRSSSRQEVESVDAGHRPLCALLVPAHAGSGRGLLTATARGVEALGLDPRIDTGHAVTALGVTSRGLLTATSRAVGVRVPLPAGEIGVTARGHTLSRIARGQAGDYLALLPACRRRRHDGWPDEKPRRVLGRLPRSLLWFLKRRRLSLLLQEGRF